MPIKKIFFSSAVLGLLATTLGLFSSCSKSSASSADTTGATGQTAVAAVGGAVSSTAGDVPARLLEEFDDRFAQCPTVHTGVAASTCYADTVSAISLGFPSAGCVYGGNAKNPIWSAAASTVVGNITAFGGMTLTITPGTGAGAVPSCGGTYPAVNANLKYASIVRTSIGSLVGLGSSTTAGTASLRVSNLGTETLAMDTTTTTGYAFTPVEHGYTRTFVSAGTHQVKIGVRFVAFDGDIISTPGKKVLYDHTISTSTKDGTSTPLTVTLVAGTPESHSVTGVLNLQHNLAKYTATSTMTGLTHLVGNGSNCCFPTAGKAVISFTDGPNVGKTETFDFSASTACTLATLGQYKFTDINGTVSTQTLKHCM